MNGGLLITIIVIFIGTAVALTLIRLQKKR
jgi:hypothetical protein